MTMERISTHTAAMGIVAMAPDGQELVKLPCVSDGFRYAREYWTTTVRNLTTTHRLQTARVKSYAAPVHITPALRAKWHALFGTVTADGQPDTAVPYLYNQSVGTLLYTRIFRDLGINFRHLLHLQHQTTHYAQVHDWIEADDQELHASLQEAWRLGDGKAMIALRIAIHRPREQGGELLGTVNDRFMIRSVPAADLAALTSGRSLIRSISGLRKREPQLDTNASGTRVAPIVIGRDMGRRFGSVSGDFNPVHTTKLAARMFGMKRPFLQGLGLRNAMLRELVRAGFPLTRFQMSFANPAYLGQTLQFVMQDHAFEVIDEQRHVVAFGSAAEGT
jgi:acyl dehydratase